MRLLKGILVLVLASLSACVTNPETGRSAFIVTSESEEASLGSQAYQEVLQKNPRSNNARWNQILQRVGKRIAAAANKPDFKWEFTLIESKEQNAFCLPGGKVAFYTGIIPSLENEAGMAVVMGHEVAHATLRHGGQRISTAMGTQVGLMALGTILGGNDSGDRRLLMAALGVGAQVGVLLPFSRSNESEADEVGLMYMARAGYDPSEAPRFWDRFGRATGGGPPQWLSTHPHSGNRKNSLQGQLPKVMPVYEKSAKYGIGEKF